MADVLIVDDDSMILDALAAVIQDMGHRPDTARTLEETMRKLRQREFAVVILDVWLPDGNGLEALPAIRERDDPPEVVILTGSGDPDGAELAIRSGAWSYITKPPTVHKIRLPVERAIEFREKNRARPEPVLLQRCGIVGDSRALRQCLDQVARAASTLSNVLITGETGTGKELFARAIHQNSPRQGKPFVVVDCAALPSELVESMLFGHERGAFTGADRQSMGLIKEADGGTLFLDEVGELPLPVQKSFLRVLQERRFRPVGGAREVVSDFRLVAATNRDLEEMVSVWKFRQDLLFRLRTITLELPPLRDRPGDIQRLSCHFVNRIGDRPGMTRKGFSPEFFEVLAAYDWPGNARELLGALESAMSVAGGDPILYPRHLPMHIRAQIARSALVQGEAPSLDRLERLEPVPVQRSGGTLPTLKEFRATTMAEMERQYLVELMSACEGKVVKACEVAGLSRARLYALLKQHGVEW